MVFKAKVEVLFMEVNHKPKMLLKLYRMRGSIDLSPDYQRGKVWSEEKRRLLLDSIFRKMDVPPVYFRVLDNGYYECVDGQQRLNAIFDFFDNKIRLSKKATQEHPGKLFEELPQNIKDIFEDHEIIVVELNKCSDIEIREMFDRLQRGMQLTAGERLNSKFGRMHDYVAGLSHHNFFKNANIRDYRSAFQQICAQITYLELYGISDVKFRNLEQMYERHGDFDRESDKGKWINRVFNFLLRAFPTKTPELHTRAGIISLYLLTSELMKEYSIKEKESLIHDFMVGFEMQLIKAEMEDSDTELLKYLTAISHSSDGANSIRTRHEIIRNYFFRFAKDLEPIDENRGFTEPQRIAIYHNSNGKCQMCDKDLVWEDFHADHKIPHSRGGKTTVKNGQALCSKCNLEKGSKATPPPS